MQEDNIDLAVFQDAAHVAFHGRESPYSTSTSEYNNVRAFVDKMDAAVRKRELEAALAAGKRKRKAQDLQPKQQQQPHEGLPEQVQFPEVYEPRYRVNIAIVPATPAFQDALEIGHKLAKRAGYASPSAAASTALARYKTLLAMYDDLQQKRSFARLSELLASRAQLPIAAYKDDLIHLLHTHQVVVLAGDTGCGKSTQVPQMLLEAGFGRIACTQPRRLSAIALARRVSTELMRGPDVVGHQVRFDSNVTLSTQLTFITEGILLRMMAGDPDLKRFDVVIVDEVHERHLTTDFLLALLRALTLQRSDLRVLVMSATINHEAFSDYFGGAPVLQVPGRLFPIKVIYMPPESADDGRGRKRGRLATAPPSAEMARKSGGRSAQPEQLDAAPYLRLLQLIDQTVAREERGDLLVFLAGTDDIRTVQQVLEPYASKTGRWILLPLHASLSIPEQDKVFDRAPDGVRKAVLATNVAEASITIDGIRFVADSGRAKHMVHDSVTGVASLQVGGVSQASADQRKGRAGRTGPGTCYRLYEEADFTAMPPFSQPAIATARLEGTVLQIKLLAGAAMDVRAFGFIEPPPPDMLAASVQALQATGALDSAETLLPLGAALAMLPVEVHLGKLLVYACMFHILNPALSIAAALSVQSPFQRVDNSDDAARRRVLDLRNELLSPHGDAVTVLQVYEQWMRA